MTTQLATFGGGCFWCTEAIFSQLKGVLDVKSGYSGGHVKHPCYREVCSGKTGHAEVIQVSFDPEIIRYEALLLVHLTTHNPTTLNRQGADRGTQYRSIILAHDEEQKRIAQQVIAEVAPYFDQPIVTEVVDFEQFYQAETHHQNYYSDNPGKQYCAVVIEPKLRRLRERYADLLG
ncbi:peptide-methionine (S)-S-oxide reductase MsrA [Vibrio vulnificus]|uniref:Peptide methionine sulfoxide reductase MsrA n=1 Tax=Vibrio vulnificus TaxID=672 RepID=A0AAW4H9S4_VIBVL|nr:peptide-methionine (S)-S-oxide reductase MsrA [Vibrio vulnificus]EHY9867296.1 peptide-methionine (S)-S-oxide reductase MsrA [Vibrio vulnificus]EIC2758810.1 peptide-methionine (S)-S-oxide reductase MsrA [Vibrio vulnificus]ELV8765063.1 peptide-methionine (S)-S-oxide reductase MsrA [Vibrio vulnificus]MBN8121366.1 peptide-methionine (S)-S-oxide reductase MsrA [Vibrio vulnificus]MCG6263301.1 peptide-methionine (S)-S-oxide reductase MsrA [Vibrio vulnificus]